jgi:hypothetical protein
MKRSAKEGDPTEPGIPASPSIFQSKVPRSMGCTLQASPQTPRPSATTPTRPCRRIVTPQASYLRLRRSFAKEPILETVGLRSSCDVERLHDPYAARPHNFYRDPDFRPIPAILAKHRGLCMSAEPPCPIVMPFWAAVRSRRTFSFFGVPPSLKDGSHYFPFSERHPAKHRFRTCIRCQLCRCRRFGRLRLWFHRLGCSRFQKSVSVFAPIRLIPQLHMILHPYQKRLFKFPHSVSRLRGQRNPALFVRLDFSCNTKIQTDEFQTLPIRCHLRRLLFRDHVLIHPIGVKPGPQIYTRDNVKLFSVSLWNQHPANFRRYINAVF